MSIKNKEEICHTQEYFTFIFHAVQHSMQKKPINECEHTEVSFQRVH